MKSSKDIVVLFLGAGPTALAGIRECGKFGLKIFAIGTNPYEAGLYSKYCNSLGVYNPQLQSQQLLKVLKEWSKDKDNPILVPTGDEFIEFLSTFKDDLIEHGYKFSLAIEDVSELFLNKDRFSKLTQEVKIPAPKTWNSDSFISLKKWSQDALYPCIIKPVYYHKWAKIYGLQKGFVVKNQDELINTYNRVSQNIKELIIQEVIEGEDENIVVFTADFRPNGDILQQFTARKIRQYPVGFGTTTAAISQTIPQIKEHAIKLLKYVKFVGVCDVEFKYDSRDKQYKIIEVNPRIGRWYGLVTHSNKQPLLSSILFLAHSSQKLKEIKQKDGLIWLFPIRDIPSIIKRKSLKSLKTYIKREKTWCIYDKDDIKPFFAYFMEMVSKLYHHKVKKDV